MGLKSDAGAALLISGDRVEASPEASGLQASFGYVATPDSSGISYALPRATGMRIELGLNVPGDVSVVGYDDVPLAAWPAFDLTTVRQPVGRMVSATVRTMLEKIADRHSPARKIELDGPLILRGSARIPQGWTA